MNYQWSGNGFSSGSASASLNAPGSNGSYPYTVTLSKPGCSNTSTAIVTINVGSNPPVGSCSPNNDQCSSSQSDTYNYSVVVPSSGNYMLKVTYRSYEGSGGIINWSVNGSNTVNPTGVGQTGIGNYEEAELGNASLNAGSNTITLSSGALFVCFQKVCANSGGSNPCPNPPAAPSVSASSTTAPCNLMATGCAGTVTWSNSAGTGNNVTVNPSSTTTYTATCEVNGCTSSPSNGLTVTGNGGGSACSAEEQKCSGNQSEVRDYTVNVPSAGLYTIKAFYQSHEGTGQIRWSVNSAPEGTAQTANMTNLGQYVEITLGSAQLNANNNIIHLKSGALYICFNKACASSSGARLGVAEEQTTDSPELTVSPNPNDGEFVARFYIEPGRKATLQVSDIQGREIWKKNLMGAGEHSEPVRLPAHSVGTFVLLLDKEATGAKGLAEFKRVIVVK